MKGIGLRVLKTCVGTSAKALMTKIMTFIWSAQNRLFLRPVGWFCYWRLPFDLPQRCEGEIHAEWRLFLKSERRFQL